MQKENQTTQNFSVDKSIIKHLVTHQTGSIEKAILELVMNSIDAKATKIYIEYSSSKLRIKDNGTGFPSREYIDKFFGVFGAPHQEGDSTYGKFRMGRGQIFAYGSSTWRSGTFEMGVDIEHRGLSYTLAEGLEEVNGCIISIELYKERDIYHNNFTSMVEYCDVDIYVNNILVNKKITQPTYENEFFIYKKDNNDGYLNIYNRGIFVTETWKHSYHGTLISKKPMEVNFARNDVLVGECEVWGSFAEYMRKTTDEESIKGINRVIPIHSSEDYVRLFFERKMTAEQFLSLKIYKDISGKNYNIFQIIDGVSEYIVKGDKNRLGVCDSLNQLNKILVLDSNLDYYLGQCNGKYTDDITTAEELIVAQLNILEFGYIYSEDSKKESKYRGLYGKFLKNRSVRNMNSIHTRERGLRDAFEYYLDVPALEVKFPVLYKTFSKKHLDVFNRDVYTITKRMQQGVHRLIRSNTTYTAKERQLFFGDSQDRAKGWTDGNDFIAIDIKVIDSCGNGLAEIEDLAYTILHEYCHSKNDTEELAHDVEFYSLFHDALKPHKYCRSISELVLSFAKSYVKTCQKHGIKPRKSITRHI